MSIDMKDTYPQYQKPEPINWNLWVIILALAAWALFEIYQQGYWDTRDNIQQITDNDKMIILQREAAR